MFLQVLGLRVWSPMMGLGLVVILPCMMVASTVRLEASHSHNRAQGRRRGRAMRVLHACHQAKARGLLLQLKWT